ncbi:hypothetical protein MTO96_045867 [Rhipicephalus appendiculatus]
MLLMIAGPAVIDVYNTLDFGEAAPGADRSQVLSVVLEKLDNYFAPRRNEVYSSVGETSQQTHCGSECNMGALNPLAKDTTIQHDENKTPSEQMDGEPVTTSGRPSRNRHMPSHFKDCILY